MKTLFCLNRWNVEPRIETWTEAENIALCTHVVYACACALEFDEAERLHAVKRTLLKSINKYRMSDMPVDVRAKIQERNGAVWETIIEDAAGKTRGLFRNDVARHIYPYLTLHGDYEVSDEKKAIIEELVRWVQYKVALSELEPSRKAFGGPYSRYDETKKGIEQKINRIRDRNVFEQALHGSGRRDYLNLIRNLKHVRRWNRMNRFIESSVLAHTFLVALLALLFSQNRAHRFVDEIGVDPQYYSIVLALFHDVTEIGTGDIITPVKEILNRHDSKLLPTLEDEIQQDLLSKMPESVRQEVEDLDLLTELSKGVPFSVSSLVKDCDVLAALLECAFEKSVGNQNREIDDAFLMYYKTLQHSEWDDVREFSQRVRYEMEEGMF